MFYIANEILKDNHLAEDAVQEAFLRVAKNFHKVNEIACSKTRNFLAIIVRNAAITMIKAKRNDADMDEYCELNSSSVSDDVFDTISNKLLVDKILKLPETHRDCLYLYHLYGYTFNEISNLLSISVEAAKKRTQRARFILKDSLVKEGYVHE